MNLLECINCKDYNNSIPEWMLYNIYSVIGCVIDTLIIILNIKSYMTFLPYYQ